MRGLLEEEQQQPVAAAQPVPPQQPTDTGTNVLPDETTDIGTVDQQAGETEQMTDDAEAMSGEMIDPSQVELGPAQEAQIEAYKDNATIMVFSEEGEAAILQSLQSNPDDPLDSISNTALLLHENLVRSLRETSKEELTEITLGVGGAHLVSELIVLGEWAKLFKLSMEERLRAFQLTMQKYIKKGLDNGTIDVIELQKAIEPMMTDEQRQYGLEQASQNKLLKTQPPKMGQQTPRQQPMQQQGQQPQPQQAGILQQGGM